MSEEVDEHLRRTGRDALSGVLPPHYPTCLGCGPDAEHGFHLEVRREGEQMVADFVFESRHSGGPGVAHGGAVATVVDDLLGFLLYLARVPGVTRKLEVEYLKPVLLGVPYALRAGLDSHEGRKLWLSCAGTDPSGTVAFRATALFLAVDPSHFSALGTGSSGGPEPVDP